MTMYRYNPILTAYVCVAVVALTLLTSFMLVVFVTDMDGLGIALATLMCLPPVALLRSVLSRASINLTDQCVVASIFGI